MMQLYGLMHVADHELLSDPARRGKLRADMYLRNSAVLAASARAAGLKFTVLGNAKDWIDARLKRLNLDGAVNVASYAFSREVPEEMPFRSTHYKLDLIRGFASGAFGDRVALLDLDVVILRHFELPHFDALWVYDIWDHAAPSHGAERIMGDLVKLGAPADSHHWYGGEFIAGTPQLFGGLAAEIEEIWPKYLAGAGSFHHSGDEMVTTPALLRMAQQGTVLRDAGELGILARWWSARTASPIPSLEETLKAAVLHLPGDKRYLAKQATGDFQTGRFVQAYRQHAWHRRNASMYKNVRDFLLGRRTWTLPRLI